MNLSSEIFQLKTNDEFEALSLKVFKYQYEHNDLYQEFCRLLKKSPSNIQSTKEIPFLPIEFFKSHEVKTGKFDADQIFLSSGTTGMHQSKHYVKDVKLYETSFLKGFEHFYGKPKDYCWIALLPSYMEREGSSLIYMAEKMVAISNYKESGFYLNEYESLIERIKELTERKINVVLLGVSFALLDLAEQYEVDLSKVVVMETGGMKGRRKELTRSELHQIYADRLNVQNTHSEYGMTELLSQAYSKGIGVFQTPPWMKIMIRDISNPLNYLSEGRTGGVNIIDLANLHSCSFIATQDLGKNQENGFEIMGRFDNSDLRGCNLLIQ